MASEPLSAATRATKRNLLLASAAVVLIKVFHISLKNVSLLGGTLATEPGTVLFALTMATLYLLGSFLIYYRADMRSLDKTDLEVAVDDYYSRQVQSLRDMAWGEVTRYFNSLEGKGDDISLIGGISYLIESESVFAKIDVSLIRRMHQQKLYVVLNNFNPNDSVDRFEKVYLTNQAWLEFEMWFVKYLKDYRWAVMARKIPLALKAARKKSIFMFRTYMWDGLLPVSFGILALAAAYDLVDLAWIKSFAPPIPA